MTLPPHEMADRPQWAMEVKVHGANQPSNLPDPPGSLECHVIMAVNYTAISTRSAVFGTSLSFSVELF
jgi:hypothetical protein